MATASPPQLPPPHTRLGVGGVLIRNGRVLVNRAVYRTRFTIPSGYVEKGEALEKALVREFEEETRVTVRVGRLLLARHRVQNAMESDVYFAFDLEHVAGEPTPRPPEIAEVREIPVSEAIEVDWISELSRTAIRLASRSNDGWSRAAGKSGEPSGLTGELYHPGLPLE